MSENISLRELRAKLLADPATKGMIRPSTKNAIYIDVDGDGPADFAFLCSDVKGDTLDTFAIDVSNDGDFDVYICNCTDPEHDELLVYPINSDVPLSIDAPFGKELRAEWVPQVFEAIRNFDGPTFAKTFKGMKAMVVENHTRGDYSVLQGNVSLRELRAKIAGDPATKDMIRPSTKNAIYIDVDGDGPADFAFLCNDMKGDTVDTFAIDLSNDGDFDLYICNCLDPEKTEILLYPINSNVPMEIAPSGDAIQKQTALIPQIIAALRNFDGPTFAKTFKAMKEAIAEDYKKGSYDALGGNFSLRELRTKLKASPATRDMIRPSTKNAIYLDVDGDGPADFALISSDSRSDMLDTFAIDVSNDGDFDIYVYNCLDDDLSKTEVVAYKVNSDVPVSIAVVRDAAAQVSKFPELRDLLKDFDAETFAKALKDMKHAIAEDFKSGNYKMLEG